MTKNPKSKNVTMRGGKNVAPEPTTSQKIMKDILDKPESPDTTPESEPERSNH